MRFAEPLAFFALLLVPLMLLGRILYERRLKQRINRAGDPDLIASLTGLGPDQGQSTRWWSTAFLSFAVALIAIALARPQFGMHTEVRKARGMDLVLALDLSRSMMAKDVVPSRLKRARAELEILIDQLRGDRIGLVGFTSVAIPLCPLTVDHTALKLQLQSASPGEMPRGGTSLAQAIVAAKRMLKSADKNGRSKSILIITDGESHGDDAPAIAAEAKNEGIEVHVAGVGSRSGEPIPLVDESGRVTGYLKDRSGQTVITRLNDSSLRAVAQSGGGLTALPGSSGGLELGSIREHLRSLKREDFEDRNVRVYEERYHWFLLPAFLLLLLGSGLRPRKQKRKVPRLAILVLPLFLIGAGPFLTKDPDVVAGNQALIDGNAEDAITAYGQAALRLAGNPRLAYNRGLAQLAAGEIDSAISDFKSAATHSTDRVIRSQSNLALGNAYRGKQNFKDAVTAYRQAMLDNPKNAAARRNLQLAQAMKRIKDLQPKQENPDGEPSEGDQDKDKEDQEQQGDGGQGSDGGGQSQEQNQSQSQDGGVSEAGLPPPSESGDAGTNGQDAEGASQGQGQDGGSPDASSGQNTQPQAAEALNQQQIQELLDALQEREKVLKRKRLIEKYGNQTVDKDW